MTPETLARIELLNRNLERGRIVTVLLAKIRNCDENKDVDCDVCLGIRYAINAIEEREE